MLKKAKKIVVNDKMQKNYHYLLSEPCGKNFHKDFKPELSPRQMLELGVFAGRYLRDCKNEYPSSWFAKAKFADSKRDPKLNYFAVDASMPLSHWQEKGWIHKDDPRGWFQWYCRYYLGRRMEVEDLRQIKRWKAIKRHVMAVKKNCRSGDLSCRRKQRQALLHWAYDSRYY